MPYLPLKQANLLKSLVLTSGSSGEIILDTAVLAKYSAFRIVNVGDLIHLIPTAAGSVEVADAQQTALFNSEGYLWEPRDGEGRLAILNGGTGSTTIYVYGIIRG